MKVTATRNTPAFEPIEVKIVLESEEELKAWREMAGNHCTNTAAMVNACGLLPEHASSIRAIFGELYHTLRQL